MNLKGKRVAIRQGLAELDKITTFTYDLSDKWFLIYFRLRCCQWLDPERDIFLRDRRKKKDFTWKQVLKAKVQDCWEIYIQFSEEEMAEYLEMMYDHLNKVRHQRGIPQGDNRRICKEIRNALFG